MVVLVIVAMTVWTYRGVPKVRARQVITLVALRLLALLLAILMLLRPSFASFQDLRIPSMLPILLDRSESMTIQDEVDGKSRWEYMKQALEKAEPLLQKLRDENNVAIVVYGFAEDISEWDPNSNADGKRTDFGQALHSLFDMHGRDRNLRSLLLFSDGADNGNRFSPLMEASKWRALPCPLHTFGLGKPTTAERQRDIAFTDIIPIPSPVPIKGKLTVKGILDAPGFVNAAVTVRLFIDDKEVLVQKETLRKIQGNEVKLVTDAPTTRPPAGEVKVTLKVDPTPGENILTNNEISTYVTVTQEGISVLLVDQPRFPEPQQICDALAADQRIRVYPAWLGQKALTPDEGNLLQFDKQHYDVIILGDVTAARLAGGNPAILDKIDALVKDQGTGLMMMGGFESLGNSDWKGTPLERMLPVFLDAEGEVKDLIKMEPTPEGLKGYILRQSDDPEKTKLVWSKLPELNGMNRLGKEKPGAKILAVRAGTNQPILVSQDYGKGRTIAFAGDTTWRWQLLGQPKSQEGIIAHARFWRQTVLWLAHQDETEGTVWVKPDSRRLAAGSKLGFAVGLRGKGGVDAKEAIFDVTVVDPKGNESPVPTAREAGGERGAVWKSDLPGEYKLVVKGHGKDPAGNPIPEDKAAARFLVYQDDAEMVRRAADHEFLAKLANSGGGKLHKPEDLTNFLKELLKTPLPQARPKTEMWPDWRRNSLSPFRVFFLLAFSFVLCLEWLLRRYWGLV
jgi:uncharacterized membrane protein